MASQEDKRPQQWYVAIRDQQVGPLGLEELEALFKTQEIGPDTLVWTVGMPDWASLNSVGKLRHFWKEIEAQSLTDHQEMVTIAQTPNEWQPSAGNMLSQLPEQEIVQKSEVAQEEVEGVPDLQLPHYDVSEIFTKSAAEPAIDENKSDNKAWQIPQPRQYFLKKSIFLGLPLLLFLLAGGYYFLKKDPFSSAAEAPKQSVALKQMADEQKIAEVAPQQVTAKDNELGIGQLGDANHHQQNTNDTKMVVPPTDNGDAPSHTLSNSKIRKNAKKSATSLSKGAAGVTAQPLPGKSLPTVKNKLEKEDIWQVVKQNAAKASSCIKLARAKGEFPAGSYTFILDWKILPDGSVAEPTLKGPALVLGGSFPGCMVKVLSRWRFPASRTEVPIRNFPFGPIQVP